LVNNGTLPSVDFFSQLAITKNPGNGILKEKSFSQQNISPPHYSRMKGMHHAYPSQIEIPGRS